MERNSEPRLIGPQPLLAAGGLAACAMIGLALLALAGGKDFFVGAVSYDSADLLGQVTAAGSAGEIFVPIDFRSPRGQTEAALSQLRLDAAEIGQVRDGLAANRLRLAMTTVWDWGDEDGDKVRLTSGGFAQDILLRTAPQ